VPRPTDLPSTWPVPYRERAERLGELLLRDWRDLAASRNIGFIVFYVPRGEDQLTGTLSIDDTWLPWLRGVCQRLAIPLVDPSRALSDGLERDGHVYDDHWTEAGHAVVASALAESLAPMIETVESGGRPRPAQAPAH
jgi:lysophospholipase L1-like esterase